MSEYKEGAVHVADIDTLYARDPEDGQTFKIDVSDLRGYFVDDYLEDGFPDREDADWQYSYIPFDEEESNSIVPGI